MAENKIDVAIKETRDGLRLIVAEMERIDKKMISIAAKAKTVSTGFKANTPQGLNDVVQQYTRLQQQIEQFSKQQNNLNTKLHDQRRKLELQYTKLFEREQRKRETTVKRESSVRASLNRQRDKELRALGQLGTAYERLAAKTKIARDNLRNMIVLHGKNSSEVRKATREYKRYQDRINQANRATSNFSKNSLGGMVRGFRNLLGAFGIVGGITMFANVARDVFRLTRQLESLDFALKTVTKTQEQFAVAQNFLLDISERYGVNLISTTERYTKFLAAANQSNLALADTERIFESVTKASAVLGLKTDELTGVYLALEQMISKGKVTTEELRRQLGERLPGAFGIMADALGVSIAQLDDMLKKGEILSGEALPKFATELQTAYGIEAVTTVDTLTSAQNKLTTAWIKFVDSVEGSEGRISKALKGAFATLTNLVDGLTEFNKTGFDVASKLVDDFKRSTRAANEEVKSFIVESLQATDSAIASNRKELEKLLQSPLLRQAKNGQIQFFGVGSSEDADRARYLQEEINRQIEIRSGLTNELTKEEQRRKMLIQQAIDLSVKYSKQQGNEINLENQKREINSLTTIEVQKRIDLLRGLVKEEVIDNETKKKGIEALRGSIAFMEEYIKKLEEQQSKLATNSDAYNGYAMAIEQAKENLAELTAEFETFQRAGDKVDVVVGEINEQDVRDSQQKIMEIYESAYDERLVKAKEINEELLLLEDSKNKAEAAAYQRHMDTMRNIAETTFGTFAEFYDIDLSNFEFLYDKKENKLEDWMTAFDDVIDSVLDASLNRYDIELQEAQRARDLIINNELATEKEKRIAREKFEEEERRIKTKRAKQERTNTLIQISVDTARGAILAYLSQLIPGDPTSIPRAITAAAVTTGFGLAQAALVASQPIPKFAEGTKSPLADDTLAWVGDGGRKEAITKGGKLLDVTPDTPTLAMLPKGAEVQKDASEWINNAIYRMNMSANGELLNSFDADYMLHDELKKMRSANDRTWQEVKKLAKRPIFVKNTVKVIQEDSYKI